MALSTTLKYSERGFNERILNPIISTSMIPVEVFVIFLIHNQKKFTISDLINIFEVNHRIKLSFTRMQQITHDLKEAGKVKCDMNLNKKNRLTSYYQFKTIL